MQAAQHAVPGRTCWRTERAGRVAFLVDGARYFAALAQALERVERSVLIVGWDFHGRTRLRPDSPVDDLPDELGPRLDALVRRRPELEVRVLEWDYSLLYALERRFASWLDTAWSRHERFQLRLDDQHPFGASQHQKLVVLDDALAFTGGLDLTLRRWDTSEHHCDDPRRVAPDGRPYDPFHDVQIAVDGAAARALGELARERWRRATGEVLAPVRPGPDPWPDALEPDAGDAPIAIARTEPALDSAPPVREVQALLRAAIAGARRSIYIESQYFTAPCAAEALRARLGERDGPEIVLVLPARCSGWIEQNTMGRLRVDLVRSLREADRFKRLRVLAPLATGGAPINVHSKLCIVDRTFLKIGSANLSARSMAMDSECDLVLESGDRPDLRRAIGGLRTRLLAEHLGVSATQFEAALLLARGSLVAAIDSLAGGERGLVPVTGCERAAGGDWMRALPIDPEDPLPISAPAAKRGGLAAIGALLCAAGALLWLRRARD